MCAKLALLEGENRRKSACFKVNSMKKSTIPMLLANSKASADDIRYATGFHAPDEFFLLLDGRKQVLFLPVMEAARARQCAPRSEIVTTEMLKNLVKLDSPSRGLVSCFANQVAGFLASRGYSVVRVPEDFPFAMVGALQAHDIHTILSPPPFPQRAVKCAREVRAIAKSQRIAVAGLQAAVQTLHAAEVAPDGRLRLDGRWLTSERLRATIESAMLLRGGVAAAGTIAAGGRQAAKPHEAGHGVLYAGTSIVLDIFPRDVLSGYWGDLTRTVVKGTASATLWRMYRAVAEAQQLAFGLLRPGVSLRRVHRAVADYFEANGFPQKLSPPGCEKGFIHGLGHSVGLSLHEQPGLRENPGRLRAGHVLSVEPGLYDPSIGGIRIEDLVEITPTGYKILAKCPRIFEIA